jgi:pyruvate/2-oxoglutarate/acetoin dehydrogenase E1 component
MPDIPVPYNVGLMNSVLPGTDDIAQAMQKLVKF